MCAKKGYVVIRMVGVIIVFSEACVCALLCFRVFKGDPLIVQIKMYRDHLL